MNIDFTYEDFITGEKFQSLADFEYLPNKEIPQKDCIIYCKTDYLKYCIPEIEKQKNTYKLISHNSDGNIVRENAREFDYHFTHFPNNIKVWFAQNVVNIFDEIRLKSIPIGLENGYNYLANEKKNWILESINNGDIFKPKEKLLYINHNIETNTQQRILPYQIFKTDYNYTIEYGKNGSNFINYRNQILNHKFMLCLSGNGHDCHRTWESLYLNCSPVVLKGTYSEEFVDMFDMFEFENYEQLKSFLENFKFPKENTTFEYCKEYLKFDFWKNLILNY